MTHIAFILDRSGSMQAIQDDAIGGFNSFVKKQAENPEPATLSLVLFDHEYQVAYSNRPLAEAPSLDAGTFVPRGTTALLDAIGRTIDSLGDHLASLPEDQRPDKIIIAILTDGMENASTDYTREKISAQIEHQRTKYAWEFVFLAANQDAIQTATTLNIPQHRAAKFVASAAGTEMAFERMTDIVCDIRMDVDDDPDNGI